MRKGDDRMPLQLIRDDLLHFQVEAIVNSANGKPNFFRGVDHTIYVNAGEELLEARKKIGNMQVSQAAITPGFDLPCQYVIHTVGPHWYKTLHAKEKLRQCYENCLNLAKEYQLKSIAFPLLSAGNNKFPKEVALQIALQTIEDFLLKEDMMVYLAIYDATSYSISKKLFGDIQSYIDDMYVHHNEHPGSNESRRYTSTFMEAYEAPSLFRVESTFQEHLFYLIDKNNLDEVDVYKGANIDKKLFSKIRSNKEYHPKKETVFALCISMKLGMDDTKDLLMKAGYAFSNANLQDVIIQYCIERKEYDINKINILLFDYKQKTLGV